MGACMWGIVSWVPVLVAIGILAYVRGVRGLKLLLACLVVVVLAVLAWNIVISFRAAR
jgi:hypothetical protein